jgi:ATP-dependent DNA helicase RecQ
VSSLDERLQARFGIESFRPWQREAVDALLGSARQVLVVAPTGGGKSLCYQFPATELEGTTVVISPLIALMEDQVRSLTARGISATWLSSTVPLDEIRRRERALAQGEYTLVYVAPERLANAGFVEALARRRPPLVAIDEAHCISEWGHDFRPDYRRLRGVLARLAPQHILACTATATPRVRTEIVAELGLDEARAVTILRGFARPNLHLAAQEIDSVAERRRAVVDAIRDALGAPSEARGGAIVYVGTRRHAEEAAEALSESGYPVAAYHAGLEPTHRADVNARFASGELQVVTATNAFGMGIDRPDIRAVVHLEAPASIESYYQEVGRAGRDGQPAYGLLLAGAPDYSLRRFLIENGGGEGQTRSEERIEQDWSRFLDLMRYVEAGSCRHDFILRYFGDEQELLGGCGHCDVCERLEASAAGDAGGGYAGEGGDEAALIVRKALAGVARARRRAGLKAVSEMLSGARTQRMTKLGFDRLSTHALLSGHDKDWVFALLRRLMTADYVRLTSDEFPVPYLTASGARVMKGDTPSRLLLPPTTRRVASRRTAAGGRAGRPSSGSRAGRSSKGGSSSKGGRGERGVILEPGSADLFEALRTARLDIARTDGVPAFVVVHDRTLLEIAATRPTTLVELGRVHGMGPTKVERYGERLLDVVRAVAT